MIRQGRDPDLDARSSCGGFTLVELMIALALIGLLAGLSLTSYLNYVEKARVARAVAEIAGIATVLEGISVDEDTSLPVSLAEIEQDFVLDPWGNPYQYLLIEGQLPRGVSGGSTALPPVAAPPPGSGNPSNPGGGAGGGGGAPPGGPPTHGGPPAIALARKDSFLVPINSDYDLYSMGKDGETHAPLNHPDSRDDVIRAGDGSYIGLAENY